MSAAKRKTLAEAWDEGALAESKAWVALVSWVIKDGTRETAPQKAANPYRAAAASPTEHVHEWAPKDGTDDEPSTVPPPTPDERAADA